MTHWHRRFIDFGRSDEYHTIDVCLRRTALRSIRHDATLSYPREKLMEDQILQPVAGQNLVRVTKLGECDSATRDARIVDSDPARAAFAVRGSLRT